MKEVSISVRRSDRLRGPVESISNNNLRSTSSSNKRVSKKLSAAKGSISKKKKFKPSLISSRKNPRRKSTPQFLVDSEGNKVLLTTVNLQDIVRAQQSKKHPYGNLGKKQQYLHKVTSPAQREAVYDRAAKALEDIETCLLPTYGGRPWKVHVTVSDPGLDGADKKQVLSPYFVFSKTGQLELAAWPQILSKIPSPPKFPGYYSSSKSYEKVNQRMKKASSINSSNANDEPESEDNSIQDHCGGVVDDEWKDIYDLQERELTPLSQLAYDDRWRVPLPNIATKWISPLREIFQSRKSAWDHAVQLCKQDVMLEKILQGYDSVRGRLLPYNTAPVSTKKAFEVGLLRFKRDGLWVVGQEEKWKDDRDQHDELQSSTDRASPRPLSGMQYYIQSHRYELHAHRVKADNKTQRKLKFKDEGHGQEEESSACTKPKKYTLKEADNELRVTWKNLTAEEQEEWKEKSLQAFKEQHNTQHSKPVPVTPDNDNGCCVLEMFDGKSCSLLKPEKMERIGLVTPSSHGRESSNETPVSTSELQNRKGSTSSIHLKRKTAKTGAWKKFCLKADQIQLCYDAGMAHYDNVIATVKARDLHRELQDGFDVFRERCRGRFDMELPAFDTPTFDFLTTDKAPWLPVVRQLLGEDVVLIHKGMFLSVPGAETQPYHQDGLHLTTQTQRDCHAVNVFVPLVDLTIKHGPTEFCLGTHILGQEVYNSDFCEVPLVPAGTPILFDYRLGHMGLANTSDSSRPIVYCTYAKAAGGREFRDTMNFSRTRYHRIGDLICQSEILSREERAQKRQRLVRNTELN